MRFFRYVGSSSGSALGRRTVEVVGRNWISSHSPINVCRGLACVKRIGLMGEESVDHDARSILRGAPGALDSGRRML